VPARRERTKPVLADVPAPEFAPVEHGRPLSGDTRAAGVARSALLRRRGRAFFESTGALHSTFGSVDPADAGRLVVFMVVPKGTDGAA
jgi:hypothetical protein